MSEQAPAPAERSYGCTYACGNPYDVIVVLVSDGTVLFLCMPCFVRTASDVAAAILDQDNPEIRAIAETAAVPDGGTVPGPAPRKRGRNAPAGSDDDDLVEVFDGRILASELPDTFR